MLNNSLLNVLLLSPVFFLLSFLQSKLFCMHNI
jgi:hypothetical protein